MDCRFSDRAELDLEAIADFIAEDNPARAISFVTEIREHCQKLTHAPKREIVDLIDGIDIRKAIHGNYSIYFAWLEDVESVFIVHITHSARNLPHL